MPTTDPNAIVELRQYTLHPQQREVLIDLFDREFVETQEALGMRVLGQFRDLDRPDQFVWLRSFADMPARHRALEGFYGGPVWEAHCDAANATMIDSDNVHLLCPAWPGATTALPHHARPQPGAQGATAGVLQVAVLPLREPATPPLLGFCRHRMAPALLRGGTRQLGWFCTEQSPNTFARLPVREGEPVLVGLALFGDEAALQSFADSGAWARDVVPGLAPWLAAAPEVLRLQPTARSALHA